ncbi:hypothetical protein SteCoe_35333 [Stentor coeruleus]|uniref:Uncharacterized protein n=1 Tax=Stentor coeruleus TaxID=5963 RepID=A0A1R2ASJ7_9CILI|nr:hypothetical protein SteCoe_35333 [Stentor coeruleus]
MRGINLRLPFIDSNFEKPSIRTDLIVEQTLSSILSEQDSNQKNYNFLRSFSSIGQEPQEKRVSYDQYQKLEEELKEKNLIIKELQNSSNELKKLIKQLQEEKDEIVNVNIKLTKELEATIEKYEKLSLRLQGSPKSVGVGDNRNRDIVKYACFIMQKCRSMPEVRVYFDDRLQKGDLTEMVSSQKDLALLVSLQVISDIIVHSISGMNGLNGLNGVNSVNSVNGVNVKSPNKGIIQENESLLHSISEHNMRMARLNKEIARNSNMPEVLQRKEPNSKNSTPLMVDL